MSRKEFNLASMRKFSHYFVQAVKGTEKDFTTGSINRAIFMLSVPMVLEMIMESLFAVVDIFYVGKIGVNAVATIGLTESVLMLVYSIAIGLSMAATATVARRIGEKQNKDAGTAAFQAILISVSLSLVISVLGVVFAKDILRAMGGGEQLVNDGYRYTQILFGGNVTIMLLFLINAIFRGAGDASLAMRSLWIANGLNIVLDPLFIFGLGPIPAFGLEGAAIATTIGRGTGVAFQLYALFKGSHIIKLTWENFVIKWDIITRLIKISLGGMGQYIIGSASWIFLVKIISFFGSEAIAGYTISFRIIIFTILPSWGMANAAATLVGQNLGAKKPDRAEKSVWRSAFYNMVFLAFVAIIFFIWAKESVSIFNDNPEVVHYGVMGLRIICMGYIFFAYGMVIGQSFNGAGDTKTPTIINFFAYWILQIPLSYFLAVNLDFGAEGVYAAIAISSTVLAAASILLFKRGKWKMVNV